MELKMEVFSPALDLLGVLEIFRSIIWEEKAFTAGSFAIESLITSQTRVLLSEENIIWIEGETAGIIEHVEELADEEGPYITVKGRLLSGILDRRILWGAYHLTGAPDQLMRYLVDDCAIHPTRGDLQARIIPDLVLADESESPSAGESIRKQKTGGTLLEALEELGETYQIAFGVRFNPEIPRMEFWTRPGVNRSVHQTANDPTFYSTELDDVLAAEYTYDSSQYRNVALVGGEGEGTDRTFVTVNGEVIEETISVCTVTIVRQPATGGSVTGAGLYRVGDAVSIFAAETSQYFFIRWEENGRVLTEKNVYSFVATSQDRTFTAVFEAKAYFQTFLMEPIGGGGAADFDDDDVEIILVGGTARDTGREDRVVYVGSASNVKVNGSQELSESE